MIVLVYCLDTLNCFVTSNLCRSFTQDICITRQENHWTLSLGCQVFNIF